MIVNIFSLLVLNIDNCEPILNDCEHFFRYMYETLTIVNILDDCEHFFRYLYKTLTIVNISNDCEHFFVTYTKH